MLEETAPVRELLGLLAEQTRFLASTRTRLRRNIAAAGLARCRALLEGMCILREQGRADAMGVLARALIEVWLVSLYVLLKGHDDDDDVLVELAADHVRHAKLLAEGFGLDESVMRVLEWQDTVASRRTPEGAPIGRRPSFEGIARELSRLLTKAEPVERFDVMPIYNRAYRAESTYSAHPTVGLFVRYIQWDALGQLDSIIDNPGAPFPRQERIGAILTTFLAMRVFKAFGMVADQRLPVMYEKLAAEDSVPAATATT